MSIRILLTGGTGLVGSALVNSWQGRHELTILTRSADTARKKLGHDLTVATRLAQIDMNRIDAVINLAGEPIADRRWSDRQKKRICESRWEITRQLVESIRRAATPPHTLISASAIGVYGRQSNQPIDESYQSYHREFSHDVCARWEELANQARSPDTRVCILRIGIVLAANGGALKKMLPAFRLGLGGPIGSGEQSMSWIHIEDLVRAIDFLLQHPDSSGIFNGTAPMAVSNRQWARLLAARLNRPALLPMPAGLVRLIFGEMGDLLLFGQNVYPQRLLDAGFQFKHRELQAALAALPL